MRVENRGAGAFRRLAHAGAGVRPIARAAVPRGLGGRIAAAGLVRAAGNATALGPREVMAAKLVAAPLATLLALPLAAATPHRLAPALVVAAPLVGYFAPDLWLLRRAAERRQRAGRELPVMLDLLRVTIDAGLSLPAAIAEVGQRHSGPIAAEWRAVARQVSLGTPLAEALAAMVTRLPSPEVVALVAALERGARHGAPLGETLAAQARAARHARRRRIHEDAARAGPKIQLAVALLLVPSVMLLVFAGLAAALLDEAAGLIGP